MNYAVETEGLIKSYKGVNAVDRLSLRVPEGAIYGFLGPNGAGKTTTVKMLTGLTRPDSGMIRICGRPVEFGRMKNRRDIGYLPDVPNFYDWMTPEEFLRLSGQLLNLEDKVLKPRIGYLLELVGLGGVKKKIGGFSRGMKQRLGIAQALVGSPKVVFLDEPTSALDPAGRKEVMDIIARLSGEATVFFSTHVLSDVERVCDRVVILNKGTAILEDTMDNLRNRYSGRAIHIELNQPDRIPVFLEKLGGCKWFEQAAEQEDGSVLLYIRDIAAAGNELPRILDSISAGIRRLMPVEPTLEDIFLKVVDVK